MGARANNRLIVDRARVQDRSRTDVHAAADNSWPLLGRRAGGADVHQDTVIQRCVIPDADVVHVTCATE